MIRFVIWFGFGYLIKKFMFSNFGEFYKIENGGDGIGWDG